MKTAVKTVQTVTVQVHRQSLAYELKSLLRATAVEQDVLERFWADCLLEEAGPLAAT